MRIESIAQTIRNTLKAVRPPAKLIPSVLLACSLIKRPGLSVLVSASNIIQRLSSHGINTTTHYVDGTPNYTNIMVNEIVSEIYRAIREDMNVQTVIKPGGITFNGVGGNAGGPVNVTGVNINFTQGQAQCQ